MELMIVVAIIGLLASVATSAYLSYIEDAKTSKVLTHYNQALQYVNSRFMLTQTQVATGVTATLPASTAEWIEEMNPTDALAPGAETPTYRELETKRWGPSACSLPGRSQAVMRRSSSRDRPSVASHRLLARSVIDQRYSGFTGVRCD